MNKPFDQCRRPPFNHVSLALVALIVGIVFAISTAGVLAAAGDLYVTNLAGNTIDVYSSPI